MKANYDWCTVYCLFPEMFSTVFFQKVIYRAAGHEILQPPFSHIQFKSNFYIIS